MDFLSWLSEYWNTLVVLNEWNIQQFVQHDTGVQFALISITGMESTIEGICHGVHCHAYPMVPLPVVMPHNSIQAPFPYWVAPSKRHSAALSNTLLSSSRNFSVYFRSNFPPLMSARGAWWQYGRGLIEELATPASSSTPFLYLIRFIISIYWRVYRRTERSTYMDTIQDSRPF